MVRKKDTKRKSETKVESCRESEGMNKKFNINFLNISQKMAWAAFQKHDVLFMTGLAGTAKAQPLDSIIYTPDGCKTMGDIEVDDLVLTPDGKTCEVIGVYPQGEKEVFEIEFNDGSMARCCGDHLWKVFSYSKWGHYWKVVDTNYLKENFKTANGRRKFSIPMTKPVDFNEKKIPLDPYFLGLLLGDGCLTTNSVLFSSSDDYLVQKINEIIDESYECKPRKHFRGCNYVICKKKRSNLPNMYAEILKQIDVWGKRSWEKDIPNDYIFNSIYNRKRLVQGLMDTDGTVDRKTGQACFCTTSIKIANSLRLIIESLGGMCSIKEYVTRYMYKGEMKEGRVSYKLYIRYDNPEELFSLPRKKDLCKNRSKYKTKRFIRDIRSVGKAECKCIMINHHDHLYLTNNFIVTHNTFLATAFAVQQVLSDQKKKIILTRPIVESGEKLGHLPGTIGEKVDPYMIPFYDSIDKMVGQNAAHKEKIKRCCELAPLAFMRGKTFDDSVCIFDESQNASFKQIKLFLTRFGQNSKIIITGDTKQSDLENDGMIPLIDVMRRLKGLPGIGMIEFGPEDIVRHPLIQQIIERLEDG